MDKKIKIISWLSVITLIIVVCISVKIYSQEKSFGSVPVGNDYRSKQITSVTGSTTNATLIKGSAGVLGSVVITGTTANSITLYDVALATNFASSTLSTAIVTFATSTPAGTYTFDINFNKGLVIMATTTPTVSGIVTYR